MAGIYNQLLFRDKPIGLIGCRRMANGVSCGGYDEERVSGGTRRKNRSGKRPLSEYNKFVSRGMRQGYSMAQVADMWRKR